MPLRASVISHFPSWDLTTEGHLSVHTPRFYPTRCLFSLQNQKHLRVSFDLLWFVKCNVVKSYFIFVDKKMDNRVPEGLPLRWLYDFNLNLLSLFRCIDILCVLLHASVTCSLASSGGSDLVRPCLGSELLLFSCTALCLGSWLTEKWSQ